MYEKILVLLDCSEAAEMVIPYAEEIADKFNGQIFEINTSELVAVGSGQFHQTCPECIIKQFPLQSQDWKTEPEIHATSEMPASKSADEILRYADGKGIELVIMASPDLSVKGSCLLRNVAVKVLRTAGKSILVVKPPAGEDVIYRRKLIRKILIPLDWADLNTKALPRAEILGKELDAELVLFHVVEPRSEIASVLNYDTYAFPPLEPQKLMASAGAYLEEVAEALLQAGLKVSIATDFGFATGCIASYASTNSIDLIAMSTHGLTGIRKWVFGSVANDVLRIGDTPILVSRTQKIKNCQ